MKQILILVLTLLSICSFAQSSFSLPGDNNWYKVATIGGQHGYLDYIYWHATAHNPSVAKGEVHFINSQNYAVQRHQTMGYGAWNQPTFALLNFGGTSELWVKATNGVATGTFKVNNSVNITLANGGTPDSDLSNNGGTLTVYDKLEDNKNLFIGELKTINKASFGNYPVGAGSSNAYSIEVGGQNPTNNSGQGTVFFHHHNVIANQLRYNAGSLFWEAAGNGDGTTTTPNFLVGGSIGIGTTDPGSFKLAVNGKIWGTEVQVALTKPGPDYVFEPTYYLSPLDSIKTYIDKNKHLPEVPSAKEMEKNGVNLGEMNMLLLKKIEELTLYVIELKKENENQNKQNIFLQKQIDNLTNKIK